MALNGGPLFTFNESISFVVECKDQQEIDYYWESLTVEGEEGATHDLSATGLCFQSDRRYDTGAKLELVLEFPGATRPHPLRCEAEVVRSEAAGDGFNIGVRLLTPLFP